MDEEAIGQAISAYLRGYFDSLLDNRVIPSPESDKSQLCFEGKARMIIRLEGDVRLGTGGPVFDASASLARIQDHIGNRFRIVLERPPVSERCREFKGVVQGTLMTSTITIQGVLKDLLVADVRLNLTIRVEALTYHFRIYQCEK